MAKQPAERFGSAGELADALSAALTEETTVAARSAPVLPVANEPAPESTPPPPSEMAKHRNGHGRIVGALLDPFSLAVLFCTLLAGLVFGLFPPVVVVAAVAYAAATVVTLRGRDETPADVPVAQPTNRP